MKTRAAVLRHAPILSNFAQTQPLTIETVELGDPGPGEVLVQTGATGLCHSDLSVITGARPRPLPIVLGHEAAGRILRLGPGVEGLTVGDRVVTALVPSCGTCPACAEGRPVLCEPGASANGRGTLLSGAIRWNDGTRELYHHAGISGFAEHMVVSSRSVVRVATEIPDHHLALFGCAVQTGVGAVVNTCNVRPGESVAIVGMGGVGLCALLGAVAAGASQIIAVDLSPEKLALARELGATFTGLADDPDVAEAIRVETRGGVDHAIELAGAGAAFSLALAITRRGRQTVAAGLASPDTRYEVPAVSLVADERRFRGSYMGSCVPQRDIPRFIRMHEAGKLPIEKLLTGVIPLERINEGFDLLHQGRAIRQVVGF